MNNWMKDFLRAKQGPQDTEAGVPLGAVCACHSQWQLDAVCVWVCVCVCVSTILSQLRRAQTTDLCVFVCVLCLCVCVCVIELCGQQSTVKVDREMYWLCVFVCARACVWSFVLMQKRERVVGASCFTAH